MAEQPTDPERLPKLTRDPAFLGLTGTQLLGAFNDNVFKQLLVLYLLGFGLAAAGRGEITEQQADALGTTYQAIGFFVFALPFVLFSGVAGWWSDRVVKRDMVIASKVAEIGVMLLGLLAFLSGSVVALFVVLFLMATQSTFFGPSKYGILPEMLRERDLPAANGLVQMTTFLAIILGSVVAGVGKDFVERPSIADAVPGNPVWLVSLFCIGIAIVGTWTATLLRCTPIAQPNAPFSADELFLARDTRALLRRDRPLFNTLIVISAFWFVAGVVQMTANEYGKIQVARRMDSGLGDDTLASILQGCIAIGIAIGCVTAGRLSRNVVRYEFVHRGALGIAITLGALTLIGFQQNAQRIDQLAAFVSSAILLFTMGFSTGFFVVPMQVVLQARPPKELKGRVIAAQNLFNFIGMLGSAVAYLGLGQLCTQVLEIPISTVFGVTGLVMLVIGISYRPSDDSVGRSANDEGLRVDEPDPMARPEVDRERLPSPGDAVEYVEPSKS